MKNRYFLLSCGAAALITFAFWNGEATAQPNSGDGGQSSSKSLVNVKCIVTLDARSNSRTQLTREMQQVSGFFQQDTVQGVVIQLNSDWLVLKDDDAENWIPRDKVLMIRTTR